jgi:hypothetical protein
MYKYTSELRADELGTYYIYSSYLHILPTGHDQKKFLELLYLSDIAVGNVGVPTCLF